MKTIRIIFISILTTLCFSGYSQIFQDRSDSISTLLSISGPPTNSYGENHQFKAGIPAQTIYGVIIDWNYMIKNMDLSQEELNLIEKERTRELSMGIMLNGQIEGGKKITSYSSMVGISKSLNDKFIAYINSSRMISLINAHLKKLIIDNKVDESQLNITSATLSITNMPKN